MSTLRIACVGDVMCGDSFSSIGFGVASSIDKHRDNFLPAEVVNVLSRHDVVLCNIECVLSDIGRKESSLRSIQMRGRPETAEYLAKWGIKVAHVANNHILEHGVDAAIDTVRYLETAGIRTVGAGRNGCFQHGVTATRLAFDAQSLSVIGACFHGGKYAFDGDLGEVLHTIEAESRENNLVIVSVHWGDELIDRPSIQQRRMARKFVSAGASLILGHHPHVVQGVHSSKNFLIAYSMGDFIFDDDCDLTRWSAILSITVQDRNIVKWEVIPLVKNEHYQPLLAEGKTKADLEREISRRCDLAEQEIADETMYEKQYRSELRTLEAASRRQLWLSIAKRFVRYPPVFWPQIVWRPIQRRVGLW